MDYWAPHLKQGLVSRTETCTCPGVWILSPSPCVSEHLWVAITCCIRLPRAFFWLTEAYLKDSSGLETSHQLKPFSTPMLAEGKVAHYKSSKFSESI